MVRQDQRGEAERRVVPGLPQRREPAACVATDVVAAERDLDSRETEPSREREDRRVRVARAAEDRVDHTGSTRR